MSVAQSRSIGSQNVVLETFLITYNFFTFLEHFIPFEHFSGFSLGNLLLLHLFHKYSLKSSIGAADVLVKRKQTFTCGAYSLVRKANDK